MSRALLRLHQIRAGVTTRNPLPAWRNNIPRVANTPQCHPFSSTPCSRHASDQSSVSPTEVSHFQSLASTWWDPHGPSRLLHLMNPLRHEFIQSCLQQPPDDQKSYTYLDIGCGGGIFASSAARLSTTASVTAIDPTPSVIAVAQQHQRSDPLLSQPGKLTYINCAIEDLHARVPDSSAQTTPSSTSDQKFDIVTLFEVIEHVPRPSQFLAYALENHLKPGGWLIGSTIARHPLSYFTTKIVGEAPWPIGMVPKGTHDWNQYVNPAELRDWVSRQNAVHSAHVEVAEQGDLYGEPKISGCVYVPLLGWKWVSGSEEYGNYFFGLQKLR